MEIITKLKREIRVDCPSFIPENIVYECIMGSHAYGCQNPETSDFDYYGVAVPPKEYIYVEEAGYVPGFDTNVPTFEQYQGQLRNKAEIVYDISVYNIVKFFKLAIDGSPNLIDSLFVPVNCITHLTKVGSLIRDNRRLFLSKKLFHSYKGYSFQQLSKIKNRKFENSKRRADVEKYGFSLKEGYHLVRLMCEVKQILLEENLDLQRDSEHYKAIRRGEFTLEEIQKWFEDQERLLEKCYYESKLPHKPLYVEVRKLLLDCLEEFYGSISSINLTHKDTIKQFNCLINDLNFLCTRYKKQ